MNTKNQKLTKVDTVNSATEGLELNNDAIAQTFEEANKESYTDFQNKVNNETNYNSKVKLVQKAFDNLIQKIIYQDIKEPSSTELADIIDMFTRRRIEAGAGIEYVANKYGVVEKYVKDSTNFTPIKRYDPKASNQMVTVNNEFTVRMTISEPELISIVVSIEKLSELVARSLEVYRQQKKWFIYNQTMEMITSANYKTINGTATDMFGSFVELLTSTFNLKNPNNEYNIDNTDKFIGTVRKEDLLLFLPQDNYVRATTGVESTLFNRQLWVDEKFIKKDNIIPLPNTKFILDAADPDVVANDGEPVVKDEQYLPNTTAIVIDKNAVVLHYQVDRTDSQFFVNNLTQFYQITFFYALDMIGFRKGLKYVNPNFSKLPSDAD